MWYRLYGDVRYSILENKNFTLRDKSKIYAIDIDLICGISEVYRGEYPDLQLGRKGRLTKVQLFKHFLPTAAMHTNTFNRIFHKTKGRFYSALLHEFETISVGVPDMGQIVIFCHP